METVGGLLGLIIIMVVTVFSIWLVVMWIILPIYIMRMKSLLEKMVDNQKKFNLKYGVK